MYAGFAFVVAALLWTYFGWLILLAGAQLSFYMQNPMYLRLGLQELRLSCVEIEQLALRMMYLVARTHLAGGPALDGEPLADELGLPGIAVAQMANALEHAGLLVVTEYDELVPARDVGPHRRVRDPGYRAPPGQRPRRAAHVPMPPVDRLLASIEEARRNRCGDLTLRDLVRAQAHAAVAGGGAPLSWRRLLARDRHLADEHRAGADRAADIHIAADCDDVVIHLLQVAGDRDLLHRDRRSRRSRPRSRSRRASSLPSPR